MVSGEDWQMKSQLIRANRADAGHYGIRWAQNVDNPQHGQWEIRCECGEVSRKAWAIARPLEMMVKQFRQAGWNVRHNKPPVCPACAHKPKEKPVSVKPKVQTITARELASMDLPPPPPNPVIARKVFRLLEDFFDADAGRYEDGWSDDRIAYDVDCSPAFVASTRAAAFGEIKEDPAVVHMRKRVETCREEMNAAVAMMAKTMDSLQSEFDKFAAARKAGGR